MVLKIDKDYVIELFKHNTDNAASTIAKKVGLKETQVHKIIDGYLAPKITNLNNRSKCVVNDTIVS